MGSATKLRPGKELPIQFLLGGGPPASPLFVRLILERPNGDLLFDSPYQMTYVGDGVYRQAGIVMPANEPAIIARFDVFTDATWDTRSASVDGDQDVFVADLSGFNGELRGVLKSETLVGIADD